MDIGGQCFHSFGSNAVDLPLTDVFKSFFFSHPGKRGQHVFQPKWSVTLKLNSQSWMWFWNDSEIMKLRIFEKSTHGAPSTPRAFASLGSTHGQSFSCRTQYAFCLNLTSEGTINRSLGGLFTIIWSMSPKRQWSLNHFIINFWHPLSISTWVLSPSASYSSNWSWDTGWRHLRHWQKIQSKCPAWCPKAQCLLQRWKPMHASRTPFQRTRRRVDVLKPTWISLYPLPAD